MLCVLKADGYGLGAVAVARALKKEGAGFFCVGTPNEALELREAGIADPVLVFGPSIREAFPHHIRHGIRTSIATVEMATALSSVASRLRKTAYVHIEVDTGLGRSGFSPEEAVESTLRIASLPGVVCEGVFTHFAGADCADLSEYTERQHDDFLAVLRELQRRGLSIPMRHCCNSAAFLAHPEWGMDGVRTGILLTGHYPDDVPRDIPLLPAFSFRTKIALLETLPAGHGVGYGLTYVTTRETRIAVLPVGYADGFSRALSNKGDVLVRGRRCPVVGRISMDQSVADVTEVPGVAAGDEVVLIGRQGNEEITAYEYARRAQGIVATALTSIGKRVPRVYENQ